MSNLALSNTYRISDSLYLSTGREIRIYFEPSGIRTIV